VIAGDLLAVAAVVAAGLGGFLIGRTRRQPGEGESRAEGSPAHAEETRFEQLIREIGVGIVTVDERGRIEAINPVATTIFEMPAQRVIGRSMIEAVPSFELDRRVREALAGRASRGQVPINVRQTSRMLTVTVLPSEGAAGALVIAIDDTRLHELEQTRRDFVSSVSHELRTPLSSINLMIETILSTDYDDEALEMFLPRVKQETDRMIHLVEDLLDLARSEGGRLRLRTEELDLAAVAANILKTFEPRAAQVGVKLVLDALPARLEGDADRLAQVLVNLVDNAVRHTPAGGTVAVDVRRIEDAATLTVRDTGVGIPFADLPHVFERFYVADRSRARDSAGTGLGLSIVKQIVEAHGGTVSANSELGFGATFTCVFPAARAGMTRASALALAAGGGLLLLRPRAARADGVTLSAAGSTALLPLLKASAQEYQSRHPSTTIAVAGGGSRLGLSQVAAGNVDLGMSDTAASGYPTLVDHRVCVVGYVVLANPAVEVTSLSKKQLQGIFAGTIVNWNEVGGPDLKVVAIDRTRGTGTHLVFAQTIMGPVRFAEPGLSEDATLDVLADVRANPGAISYAAFPGLKKYVDGAFAPLEGVRELAIDGVAPSEETIGAGTYPLWSYEHVYTNGPPTREASRFLALVESNVETIHALGFVPMRAMQQH